MSRSARPTDDDASDSTRGGHRLRFEIILGSVLLAIGLFVLPALVFWVGTLLLGNYGGDMSAFYGAFFADLAAGQGRTWLLALGPLLLISLVRVIFIGTGSRREADDPDVDEDPKPSPPPRAAPSQRRVEPRIERS